MVVNDTVKVSLKKIKFDWFLGKFMNPSFLVAVLEKVSNVEVPYMDTFLNGPTTHRI